MNVVLLIIVATIGATAFATAGVWLGRRLLHKRLVGEHHEVVVALFQTGGTLHAVFLAFLVVAVWQSYDAARTNVAEEASALTTLYRASTGMDSKAGTELRRLLREYTGAVIQDEWAIQSQTGGASPRARAASLTMYRLLGQEDPEVKQNDAVINGAVVQIISQIQSDRNKRTLAAEQTLPMIIWLAAIGSGAIVLSMSFLLSSEQVALQMALTSVIASMIALLLCITFVLSHPFFGPMALQPDPFKHSLEVFDAVDATPSTAELSMTR